MKTENILLELYPEIDYALVYRPEAYEKFVAAWHYNEETGKWGQGHYFYSLRDAVNYINEKYEKPRKAEMTAKELLSNGADYIAERSIDAYESKDLNSDWYWYQKERISAMKDLLEYLEEREAEAEYEG